MGALAELDVVATVDDPRRLISAAHPGTDRLWDARR
jgi:hypothetical protein